MRSIIASPHDKFVRASLSNLPVAREFFEKYLPQEIRKTVNLNVLKPCPGIHINKHLELSASDIIYQTEISGNPGYILATEHQHKSERFMPLRVLEYDLEIWGFHRKQYPQAQKLPLIINLVFYSGKSPYTHSADFRDLLDAPRDLIEAFWLKPFTLVQVRDIPDKELLKQKWAGLFQYLMKKIRSPDLLDILKDILPLIKDMDAQHEVNYIEEAVHYALNVGEISDTKAFIEILTSELSPETGEKIMTGAQQLIEMGKQEGIQQGMQQGMQRGMQQGTLEGERTILKKQLMWRFSAIPDKYREKIDHADTAELENFAKKFLEAKTLEDIFENYH